MTSYRLDVVFAGVQPEDETLDRLETIPFVHWIFQDEVAHAVATLSAPSAIDAANWLVSQVSSIAPEARPVRLDRDLVSVSDVAHRVGVSREAVRHWVKGSRRANSDFPEPVGVVGDGIRVWCWSAVNAWLELNLDLGDGLMHPSEEDLARIDLLLQQWSRRLDGVERHAHWTILSSVKAVEVVGYGWEATVSTPSTDSVTTVQRGVFTLAS